MAIFLDTGDIDQIMRFHQMGLIRGVTTNPSILLKEGVSGGLDGVKRRAAEIAERIAPYPLSMEVTTNDPDGMLREAEAYSELAANINVKITVHGPEGELDNMAVIHELETRRDVRVNVTAMMSAQQCFLAAMAGATFVSIFGGRVNNMGYDSREEISKLRELLDGHGLDAQIIVGSVREILNVVEWLHAGAHIVTVTPALLSGMLVHPYSKETVKMFLDDAAKLTAAR